ncbi:MAG: outer-membrane lipoprotein carrier protein LolA [Bacteroidales bacterium]|nr:outer-membrane lipoprotein carrier protein LolA [Bacteroidales bacterium]
MKKFKFIIILVSILSMNGLMAQNTDGGATVLLKKVAAQYQAYSSIQFHYTMKTTKEGKTLHTYQGDFALKGSKYKTNFNGQTFFCDGKSIWNYQKSTNEVSIFEYDPEDDENMMNPQLILKNWDKQFRAKLIRDEFINEQPVSLIDLTPKVNQSYYRIRLFINKNNHRIIRIAVYEKDNTIYTYYVEQFKSNVSLSDSYFVFDKSKYPGVEVNDMR